MAWAECRRHQWSYLTVGNNDKEYNMRRCLNLEKWNHSPKGIRSIMLPPTGMSYL